MCSPREDVRTKSACALLIKDWGYSFMFRRMDILLKFVMKIQNNYDFSIKVHIGPSTTEVGKSHIYCNPASEGNICNSRVCHI